MNTNKKYFMHTRLNMLAFFAIFPIIAIFSFFIFRDAYNKRAMIIGIATMAFMLNFFSWLFIAVFRIFDRLEFTSDGVTRHSVVGRKLVYSYAELSAAVGVYSSAFEEKKCIILTPKKLNAKVIHIDTSKFGNVKAANRLGVLYCAFDDSLADNLRARHDLEWS